MLEIILLILRQVIVIIIPRQMQKLIPSCHADGRSAMIKAYIPIERERRVDIREIHVIAQRRQARTRFSFDRLRAIVPCDIVRPERRPDLANRRMRDEDAQKVKLAPGVFFTHEKTPCLRGKQLPLSDALFHDGVLAFDDLKSDAVTIRSTKSAKSLTISAPGFPYWGFWMPEKGGAPFLCLEPWYGHADVAGSDGAFEDKEGVQKLAPSATFHAEYTISIG